MLCITLFGLIANPSFILTVVKTPSLRSSTFILLTCLACSDCIILITCLGLVAYVLLRNSPPITDITVQMVSTCFSILCLLFSSGLVILASAEQFLAICHPLKHHKLKGTKRTHKLIVIVSLISVVILGSFTPALLFQSQTRLCIIWPAGDDFHVYSDQILVPNAPAAWQTVYEKISSVSFAVIFLLILASVSYMYAKILIVLSKRKRNTNLQMSAIFKKHIEQVSVMVIVNGGVYFLLTTVYITYITLVSLSYTDLISWGYWQLAALASYIVNASINPLLYFLTNQRYRCAVKTMFEDCFRKAMSPQNPKSDSSNDAEHQL